MSKPRRRAPSEVTLDALTVAHVQRAHGPASEMLKGMSDELAEIRREWDPRLAEWAALPWATWVESYWVKDLRSDITALTARLAGVEAAGEAWRERVRTLTPRAAWRYGSGWRREAIALRHDPTLLLQMLQTLRDKVADAAVQVARYGPVVPSPRPAGFVALDREALRGREWPPSKTAFDPHRIGQEVPR